MLMFIQNVRRLAESLLISVYSKSTINIMHYFAGIGLYSTFHIAVLCEAPSLEKVHAGKATEAK